MGFRFRKSINLGGGFKVILSAESATEHGSIENNHAELPPVDLKKIIKKALLWVVTVFFGLIALAFLTSDGILTGLFALALIALIIPIEGWQAKIKTIIKSKMKPIIAVALAILCFAAVPTTESTDVENTVPPTVATESTNKINEVTEATTEATTEPMTESTTEPATEPATEPMTEPATEPITEPTTEPIEDDGRDYVVNKNTGKFHYPSCASVDDIKASNRWDYHGTREELIDMGYQPCGRCHKNNYREP